MHDDRKLTLSEVKKGMLTHAKGSCWTECHSVRQRKQTAQRNRIAPFQFSKQWIIGKKLMQELNSGQQFYF